METVAQKHQMNIARKTLRMTPAMARIMGGMDYETAYKLVFRTELRERLKTLVAEYGDQGPFCWELGQYGWDNPRELLAALT